jgi:FHS family L-fucose permease-like MFS transporter
MARPSDTSYRRPLAVLTVLFFMWGFLTSMNDVLIPYLKGVFALNYFRAMLVQFAFFGAYFIGSVIYFAISARSGDPIQRMGYKNGIVAGLLLSASGAALFWPAAQFVSYPFFLSALFILGLGFTLLQISANPYVTLLGDESTAPSRLNLSQGFNSLGTTIGPLLGGFLVFKYFAGAAGGADSVKVPYLVFAGVLLLIAVLISFEHLPRVASMERVQGGMAALRYPHLVLGIVAIFAYVGAEVSVGSILISFLGLPQIAGMSQHEASTYVAFYWGGLMIGRFMGAVSLSELPRQRKELLLLGLPAAALLVILYLRGAGIALTYGIFLLVNLGAFRLGRFLPGRTTWVFALAIVGLLGLALALNGRPSMWCVIAAGLFNSIMWSNIFSLAIEGLGEHKSQASSLLVMAIIGGALFPLAQGAFADRFGVHRSFVVPMLAYLYIAYYGWRGHEVGRSRQRPAVAQAAAGPLRTDARGTPWT